MEIEEKAKIKSVLKQILMYSSKSNFSIKNLGYLPRWIILSFDVFAIFISGLVTYYLFKGIGLQYYKSHGEGYKIVLFFVTNIFFFLFKMGKSRILLEALELCLSINPNNLKRNGVSEINALETEIALASEP